MTKLLRPYIPLSVRLIVAGRQLLEKGIWTEAHWAIVWTSPTPLAQRLAHALEQLFGNERCHLDHNPALGVREKIIKRGKHVGYIPDANDPNHLLYRTTQDHHIKTNVRGDGAQYSDTVLMKRERKRQKKKSGRKRKWRWPKGRKIPKRVKPWGR